MVVDISESCKMIELSSDEKLEEDPKPREQVDEELEMQEVDPKEEYSDVGGTDSSFDSSEEDDDSSDANYNPSHDC